MNHNPPHSHLILQTWLSHCFRRLQSRLPRSLERRGRGQGLTGKKFFLTMIVAIGCFLSALTLGLCDPAPAAQAQGDVQAQAFVLLKDSSAQQLAQVQAFVEINGGQVSHVFPHQAIIARIPPGVIQQLAALPGVVAVFTQAVDLSTVDRYGPQARCFASVWNSLVTPQAAALDVDLMAEGYPDEHNDAFIAPDLPSADEMSLAAATSVTPGYYQTSEYMAGSVAVGIVLLESDGSFELSTEDWTFDEKQQVFNEIVAGLNWWAELEPRANLRFVYDDHFSDPLPTGVEPISHSYIVQQIWIAEAMGALGYDAASYFTRVRDYNNELRATYQTDWAFTIFVVDSSTDWDNRFKDGYFAYAYLGGPFMVMTYGNNGYGPGNMDAVTAHEIGHIFYALDQYSNAHQPCTRRSGYLDVENQNSRYGDCASNVSSIMRGQVHPYTIGAIDPYAAGQVGWRDSDGDGILDPLDTDLPISIDSISVDGNSVTVSGMTEIVPYPSPSLRSVTINTLMDVQYRFDGSCWQQATADDGVFDGTHEGYRFTVSLPPGLRTLEVAALDSAGNMSDAYATETIVILDPVDGGLNTELFPLDGPISAGELSTMDGTAYHLQGGIVADVQYRVDGGPWQSINALDDAFDSDQEYFAVPVDSLEPGAHLIEARAIDAGGGIEANFASQQVTLVNDEPHTVFLPIVVSGM